jgi:hypothetical protein
MAIMTEHQRRLWQGMVDLIQRYLDGETTDFYGTVGKLEGSLDAAEIKDSMLVDMWYGYWTPLEARRAIQGNDVDAEKAKDELVAMKTFLLRQLRNSLAESG